jgi:hypothetical protein
MVPCASPPAVSQRRRRHASTTTDHRKRTRRSWSWRLPVCTFIVILAFPVPASAEHDGVGSQHYSRDTQRCESGFIDNIVDPVGIMFYGAGAGSGSDGHSRRVDFLLELMEDPEDHNWQDIDGGTQYLGSGGGCTVMEHQAGTNFMNEFDGFDEDARYHVRLNQNSSPGPGPQFRTAATPHYDVKTARCGDQVPPHVPNTSPDGPSGYDYARGHVKNDWLDFYGSDELGDVQNWRNTRRNIQCLSHWQPHSTGRVYWLNTD